MKPPAPGTQADARPNKTSRSEAAGPTDLTCRRIETAPRKWSAILADVDGVPSAPTAHARGTCLGCGAAMVAKTGRVRPHWAHATNRDWDPWWETETEWHRDWKGRFPEQWREVGHVAANGEVHRADVETPRGLVLEFQHSALSDVELRAREAFYPELVWVLDGRPFRNQFEFYHALPHPDSPLAADIVWSQASPRLYGTQSGIFFRVSEWERDEGRVAASKADVKGGWLHFYHQIEADILAAHRGHYQYGWVKPRRGWLSATMPVFIDFGDGTLWKLGTYDDTGLTYARVTSVERFVMAAECATDRTDLEALLWPPPEVWPTDFELPSISGG